MKLPSKVAIVLAFVLTGCSTCTGVGDFTVTRETGESIVAGSTSPLNDLLPVKVIPDLDLDFDLEAELARQDAKGAKEVHLNGLVLQITDTRRPDGDEDDFDFLDRIEFRVASADPGSDLEEVVIANLESIPEGVDELELETDSEIDLKPYAEEGIVLTTSGAGSVPPDDVSVRGIVTIEVETL